MGDIIDPGYRHDEGGIGEFDQIHAEALDLLRRARAFYLTVDDPDGDGVRHIAGVALDEPPASAFFATAAMEAVRLQRLAARQEDEDAD